MKTSCVNIIVPTFSLLLGVTTVIFDGFFPVSNAIKDVSLFQRFANDHGINTHQVT